jgi:hypothetical protein
MIFFLVFITLSGTYLFYKLGYPPQITLIFRIIFTSIIALFFRILIVSKIKEFDFNKLNYILNIILKPIGLFIIGFCAVKGISFCVKYYVYSIWTELFLIFFSSIIANSLIIYFLGIEKEERLLLNHLIKKYLK